MSKVLILMDASDWDAIEGHIMTEAPDDEKLRNAFVIKEPDDVQFGSDSCGDIDFHCPVEGCNGFFTQGMQDWVLPDADRFKATLLHFTELLKRHYEEKHGDIT